LYAPRIAALYPAAKEFQFWRVENKDKKEEKKENHAAEEQRRLLEKEKSALVRELLGIDYKIEMAQLSGEPSKEEGRNNFLSTEKQTQVKALSKQYREMERALPHDGDEFQHQSQLAGLRAQFDAELIKVLSPDEFQEYQLRNSSTARKMREELTAFQPNREEFRAIFELQKTFDDQFPVKQRDGNETYQQQHKIAQQQLNEQLQMILGEQRFHDYDLSQRERFRDIYDFTRQYELPRETAETVYNIRRAAEKERQKLDNDKALSSDLRNAALLRLSKTAQDTLAQTLGPDVWKDYRHGRGWIEKLGRDKKSN
ncbi:MAG: hypothetical protein ACR2H1_11960, partial [Limisphaerales bacterium]